MNIILIGMPGVGKSTIGVVLAKNIGFHFMDSDLVIQQKYGKLLHELIEANGTEGFLTIEDEVNASINVDKTIIATGGSAVYGENAMAHLKENGLVVYLSLPLPELADRLGDLNERGVAIKKGQTLESLMEERSPLYEKYADIVIDCHQKQIREIVAELASIIKEKM